MLITDAGKIGALERLLFAQHQAIIGGTACEPVQRWLPIASIIGSSR